MTVFKGLLFPICFSRFVSSYEGFSRFVDTYGGFSRFVWSNIGFQGLLVPINVFQGS